MLVVDGTFEEQADELATFLDTLTEQESKVQETVDACLQEEDNEGAITALVDASSALNAASEREFEPSYNLFIHLTQPKHIDTILENIKSPPSFPSGPAAVHSVLTTLFNVSEPQYRLKIFRSMLDLCQKYKLHDAILPKIRQVPTWIKEWQATPEDTRALYVQIADLCESIDQRSTEYLIRAIETYSAADDSTELTVRTVVATINEPERLSYDDLLILPAVKALEKNSPQHYELLTLLSTGTYADYKTFPDVDNTVVERKFRLLTLVTLAAKQDSRKLRYESIAEALNIPQEDVEKWVIDTIKTGLVEGKLSQTSETFLIHRATFRTFEAEQWEEVSAKLASWKDSLQGILEVLDNVRNDLSGGPQLTNGYVGSEVDGDEEDEAGEVDSLGAGSDLSDD